MFTHSLILMSVTLAASIGSAHAQVDKVAAATDSCKLVDAGPEVSKTYGRTSGGVPASIKGLAMLRVDCDGAKSVYIGIPKASWEAINSSEPALSELSKRKLMLGAILDRPPSFTDLEMAKADGGTLRAKLKLEQNELAESVADVDRRLAVEQKRIDAEKAQSVPKKVAETEKRPRSLKCPPDQNYSPADLGGLSNIPAIISCLRVISGQTSQVGGFESFRFLKRQSIDTADDGRLILAQPDGSMLFVSDWGVTQSDPQRLIDDSCSKAVQGSNYAQRIVKLEWSPAGTEMKSSCLPLFGVMDSKGNIGRVSNNRAVLTSSIQGNEPAEADFTPCGDVTAAAAGSAFSSSPAATNAAAEQVKAQLARAGNELGTVFSGLGDMTKERIKDTCKGVLPDSVFQAQPVGSNASQKKQTGAGE